MVKGRSYMTILQAVIPHAVRQEDFLCTHNLLLPCCAELHVVMTGRSVRCTWERAIF